MKTIKRTLVVVLVTAILFCAFAGEVIAGGSKTVDYNPATAEYSTTTSVKKMKSLAKKIGGMKKYSSSTYPDFYMKGRNVVIGVKNTQPGLGKNWQVVKNLGNKKLTIRKVKIGDTRATVKKKMAKCQSYNNDTSGRYYYFKTDIVPGEGYKALRVIFSYKNGRVSKWTFTRSTVQ